MKTREKLAHAHSTVVSNTNDKSDGCDMHGFLVVVVVVVSLVLPFVVIYFPWNEAQSITRQRLKQFLLARLVLDGVGLICHNFYNCVHATEMYRSIIQAAKQYAIIDHSMWNT